MSDIPILDSKGQISSTFVRANDFILEKYGDTIKSKKDIEVFWMLEFGANLKKNNGKSWDYIGFNNPKQQLLFSFKFQ
jgi:hypothetical protein